MSRFNGQEAHVFELKHFDRSPGFLAGRRGLQPGGAIDELQLYWGDGKQASAVSVGPLPLWGRFH